MGRARNSEPARANDESEAPPGAASIGMRERMPFRSRHAKFCTLFTMAAPPRTAQTGTFFVTTVTANRRRLFQVTRNAELFLETLQHYRALGHYKLHAFVVMPDHVHLLLTTQSSTIFQIMNLIKGGFSHRLSSPHTPRQRGFTDHLVRNREEFDSRLTYIHQNPVADHLTSSRALYPYSSACRLRHNPPPASLLQSTGEFNEH